MPYNANIPQAADRIKDSQAQVLDNFTAIPALLEENHVGFVGGANDGKHKHVSFPEQGASPVTAVDEVALFSRLSTLTGEAELAIRKENNGAVNEFTSFLSGVGTGWMRLPSGVLLKWGFDSATGYVAGKLFPAAANIPVFTAISTMILVPAYNLITDGDGFARLSTFNTTTYAVYCSQRSAVATRLVSYNYLAIGV